MNQEAYIQTIKNAGLRCKVTGATDVGNILKDVFESIDYRTLSRAQMTDLVDRAVKEYELLILRQLR